MFKVGDRVKIASVNTTLNFIAATVGNTGIITEIDNSFDGFTPVLVRFDEPPLAYWYDWDDLELIEEPVSDENQFEPGWYEVTVGGYRGPEQCVLYLNDGKEWYVTYPPNYSPEYAGMNTSQFIGTPRFLGHATEPQKRTGWYAIDVEYQGRTSSIVVWYEDGKHYIDAQRVTPLLEDHLHITNMLFLGNPKKGENNG